jgi:hypothetical protein
MIANKQLVQNQQILTEATSLHKAGFITREQLGSLKNSLQLPKTSNSFLVRAGFFILGLFLVSSISGALSLFVTPVLGEHYVVVLYFYAVLHIALSELSSRMQYYNYGLDDAFYLSTQLFIAGALYAHTESVTVLFMALSASAFIYMIRYVHTPSAFVFLSAIVGGVVTMVVRHAAGLKPFLPFIILGLAIILYVFYLIVLRSQWADLYRNVLKLSRVIVLSLGYLSMNYLVVRELSESLMGIEVSPEGDIPYAVVFYVSTFAIPLAILVFSIQRKSKTNLILSLLMLAFSIYSIRVYHARIPLEQALIGGGLLLFAVSFFFIRKLSGREHGVTFIKSKFEDSEHGKQLEALMAVTGVRPAKEADSAMPFGGGGFSGGGAGSNF